MLEIIDLAKRYGPVVALDGATFTARPGRIVGFLGPNGAGKTTTMRCIFGLARPDRGEVRWKGAVVDRDARLRFGYMPEQRGLYPRMRVAEQLSYFAQQHGMRGRDADAAAGRWLERMGLADRAKSKLEELSHGNQQRIQLATALVHDPELLVLDEPFSGLDPIGIATMTEVVRERSAAGVGVVFSSHQLDLVEDVCEDVVIIARGAGRRLGRDRGAQGRVRPPASRDRGRRLRTAPGSTAAPTSPSSSAAATGSSSSSTDRVDLDELLARARAAGEVRTVRLRTAEAVRAVHGSGRPGGRRRRRRRWRDAALAEHLAGRPARDPRAGRQPRLRPDASLFTTLVVIGSFIVPALLFGDDEATPDRRRRAGAGRRSMRRSNRPPRFDRTVAEIVSYPDRRRRDAALEDETVDVVVDVPPGPLRTR